MGKKLRDAPVYFTIVQARFNPILKLDSYAPAIQDSLRKRGFPDAERKQLATFNLNFGPATDQNSPQISAQQTTRYVFANMEKTSAFLLDQAALSLQTTAYDTFEAFSSTFLEGLETVHREVTLAFTDRIGVRYLNAVFPRDRQDLRSQLNPSVLGLYGQPERELLHAFTETLLRNKGTTVVARSSIQTSPVGFPPDLQPNELALAEQFNRTRLHAILDIDGHTDQRQPFSLPSVKDHLMTIHTEVENAFQALVSAEALRMWE